MPFATQGSDSMLEVEAGTPFEVRPGAAPPTGHGWEIAHPPPGVELLGGDAPGGEATTGDGEGQLFRLVASHPGRFELRFLLKRGWEQEPIEIRVVQVEAR
jgi:hypothetical protein